MDIPLKQRLIGAAVLIALGVIFIPILLDGAGQREQSAKNMRLSKGPEFVYEEQIQVPLPEIQAPVVSATPDMPSGAEPEPEPEPETAPPVEVETPELSTGSVSESAPAPPVVPFENAPAEAVSAPVEPIPEKIQKPQPVQKAPEKKPVPKEVADSGWVVQVGSFSKRENAYSLRDKLRSAGFGVFSEQLNSSGKQVYRVIVGPEKARNDAEVLQANLLKKQHIKGIVKRYQ